MHRSRSRQGGRTRAFTWGSDRKGGVRGRTRRPGWHAYSLRTRCSTQLKLAEIAMPRAVVIDDDDGAHAWWTSSIVASALKREPPLALSTLQLAAACTSPYDCDAEPLLLTANPATWCGVHVGELDGQAANMASPFSTEYVYHLADIAKRTDRTFRKACVRADAVVHARSLRVVAHSGSSLSDALIGRCIRCRNVWLERRLAQGAPQRSYFLSALKERRGRALGGSPSPLVAILAICGGADDVVVGYVLTERVGHTVAAVDGVHDYTIKDADPRADPSALLLHAAASWWSEEARGAVPPLWLNDGPAHTAGLLQYKSQYHGRRLDVLLLERACGRGAHARARWRRLREACCRTTRSRRRHVGAVAIQRAARRIYTHGEAAEQPTGK